MTDESLEARIAQLEERVARLESHAQPARAVPESRGSAGRRDGTTPDATLIGKSVLMIGGAYVLRALTELGVLPDIAGVILALVYALFWMAIADRAMSRGRTVVAMFDAGTAALISGAVLWEATTRFHLLTTSVASVLVVVMSLALIAIAYRRRSATAALISAVMASVTCIGIAIWSADLVAPTVAASFVGVVISWLSSKASWPMYLTLLLAGASDSLAVPLIVMTAMGKSPHGVGAVELALSAFALLWLVAPMARGQAPVAMTIGFGGAAMLASFHGGHPNAIATTCFVISAVTYFAAMSRRDTIFLLAGAIAAAIGSFLVIEPAALAIVCAIITASSAAIGRRLAWDAMSVHAAAWAVAAFATALRSPVSLLAVCAAAVASLLMMNRSRLVLLAVATASLIVAAASFISFDQRFVPLTRTAILAIAAVVLSIISRRIPEAVTIARVVLVIAGLKLLIEDLRFGQATTIVVALALYGGAMLIVARRRVYQ